MLKTLFSLLTVFLCLVSTGNALDPRCQSVNRCAFTSMPLYHQLDTDLFSHLGTRLGQEGFSHYGLCAPVAAAMVLEALFQEKSPQTKFNHPHLKHLGSDWRESVFLIGQDMKTNFSGTSGTKEMNMGLAFMAYHKATEPAESKFYTSEDLGSSELSKRDQDSIISDIRKNKMAFIFNVVAFEKRKKLFRSWIENTRTGHALAVNGYEGKNLLIFDPWGVSYPVKIIQRKTRVEGPRANSRTVAFLENSSALGFTNSTHAQGRVVVLKSVLGFAVR